MKAVIMAGGEGARLRPLTCGRPKPMVPVANKPVMEYTIELLKRYGISDIAVTLQYMPNSISGYFESGNSFGTKMRYYIEKTPLGTAGSIKNAEGFLDDTFVVISGDALTDINLADAVKFHKDRKSLATLVLKRIDIPLEYGVVITDKEGRITRFVEKPGWGEVFSDTVNTGIYVLSPEIFRYISADTPFDFSRDLFPRLLYEKKALYGYITDGYWCDIGDIAAYLQANGDILNGRVKGTIVNPGDGSRVLLGEDSIIDPGAFIESPSIIGARCFVGEGAVIGRYSVIGDNSIIEGYCSIKRSVIWNNCYIGPATQVRGSIICDHASLKKKASVFEQSVVGDYTIVGEQAVIKPGVKIWPDKYIGHSMEINSNLVWGTKAERRFFSNRGVVGDINVDITPEFAARLGAAFGAMEGKTGGIGIGFDGSAPASMIMNAFISGLLSSGAGVDCFGKVLLPGLRSAVRLYRLNGGVYIGSCFQRSSRLYIDFINKKGSNIDGIAERKIENALIRDDYRRCSVSCLKSTREIKGFNTLYINDILRSLKTQKMDYKIGLRANFDFAAELVNELLTEVGCEVVMITEDMVDGSIKNLCEFIRKEGFDLGVSMEESCEKMLLIDPKGRLITEDMFIALISLILLKALNGGTIMVPVTATSFVELMAEKYNGTIVRTKTSANNIMNKMLEKQAKEEMLEQFTMHFDAVAGLAKLLDFMSINDLSLSELVDMIPEIHMHRQEVKCEWNAKGKVMRKLIQEHEGEKIETLEGVKIYKDKGWALVLPDPERPVCSIISEGFNTEFAKELTDIYARKIRTISRS